MSAAATPNDFGVITVGEPSASSGAVPRASAEVLGEQLWFESDGTPLTATAEAFATALLPIAVFAGAQLELERPLDPVWARNAARTLRVWNEWWDTEPNIDRVVRAERSAPVESLGAGTALCFTLGVDSFHSLLRSDHEIDELLVAHGYDIPLADATRIDAVRTSLADVSAATGVTATVIRTNLREHPAGIHMDWERSHGGAIAALGHCRVDRIGDLLVSASLPYYARGTWGSHHRTDSGWSSSRLRVTHIGAELRRAVKLQRIADERVVQRNLRVCWENRAPSGNCGECEKCVRTMLVLTMCDRLDRFTVFPHDDLVARIDAIPAAQPLLADVYRELVEDVRERRLRRAVKRLIKRGQRAESG